MGIHLANLLKFTNLPKNFKAFFNDFFNIRPTIHPNMKPTNNFWQGVCDYQFLYISLLNFAPTGSVKPKLKT